MGIFFYICVSMESKNREQKEIITSLKGLNDVMTYHLNGSVNLITMSEYISESKPIFERYGKFKWVDDIYQKSFDIELERYNKICTRYKSFLL